LQELFAEHVLQALVLVVFTHAVVESSFITMPLSVAKYLYLYANFKTSPFPQSLCQAQILARSEALALSSKYYMYSCG
jgi:hypothetical protein